MSPSLYRSHTVFGAALLRLRQGWCAGAMARTRRGDPCHPHAAQAVSWSLLGAVMRAAYDTGGDYSDARELVRDRLWQRYALFLFALNEPTVRVATNIIESLLPPTA